jgi:hypothetical protein
MLDGLKGTSKRGMTKDTLPGLALSLFKPKFEMKIIHCRCVSLFMLHPSQRFLKNEFLVWAISRPGLGRLS